MEVSSLERDHALLVDFKREKMRLVVNEEIVLSGIFLDLDLRCLRPLDPLRQFEFVSVAATPMGISNGFLMSSPRHPFLESVVKSLPRYNINWLGLPYATVMFTTGCHFLSYVSQFSLRLQLIILELCMLYFLEETIYVFYGDLIVFIIFLEP